MMYWLSVYLMVAIIVAGPFLLLYLLGFAVRLIMNKIAPAVKRPTRARPSQTESYKAHWSAFRRKAA